MPMPDLATTEAIALALKNGGPPDVVATRKNGTLKYGFGVSWDQELSKDVGLFGRWGWNNGKTESFAFTAIDSLAMIGISVNGNRWRRADDTVATEFTSSGLSAVHAEYLAMGGHDFLIGDGRLNYGRENIWESYYNAKLFRGFFAAFDLQYVNNPAYNRDRGPVWIESIRPGTLEYALRIRRAEPDRRIASGRVSDDDHQVLRRFFAFLNFD